MTKFTRRHLRKTDLAWAKPLLGEAAIIARGNYIEIAEDGPDKVLVVWYSPENDDVAILGIVLGVGPFRRDLFYGAILTACEAAIVAGHTKATFRILDRRLVLRIKRDFQEEPTPEGRNVKTGQPGHWELTVNLTDAATKLRRFVL